VNRSLRRAGLVGLFGLIPAGLGAGGATATTTGNQDLSCATYTTPGLDVAPTRVSTMVDGVPYVVVCVDHQGREVVNETFLYGVTAGLPS
jgi:hypothetical protein